MWKIINTNDDIQQFMEKVGYFHDSCIKEMCYVSGAYVNEDLSMYPINNRRVLRVVVQRQFGKEAMMELEFHGLKALKLFPVDESYTCEILDSTMILKNGDLYWCDRGGLTELEIDEYTGTLICASKLRWRAIENYMGEKEFYHSEV